MTVDRCTPARDLPELLRVDEAAAWLDIGPGTVREMVRRREIACVRLGRLVRIPRTALEKLGGTDA